VSSSRLPRFLLIGAVLLLMAFVGYRQYLNWQLNRFETSLKAGRQYLAERRDELAEEQFAVCLGIRPEDADVVMLWAEAVMGGRSRTGEEAAALVLPELAKIPDESPLAGEVRMREGRLLLLVLHRPDAAERKLRRATQLDPEIADSWYLLWKLYDLTNRFERAETFFVETLRRTAPGMRAERLRDWYLSQFSQGAANAELDRLMGFLGETETAGDQTVDQRLQDFVSQEPDSLITQTAQAAFFIQLRDRQKALEVLQQLETHPEAYSSDWYLSLTIELLLDLGQLDEAEQLQGKWAAEKDSYSWHRCAGRIDQVIHRDDESAIRHFSAAQKIWPGPTDWSLLHFQAQSAARLGRKAESIRLREEADRIEKVTELELHRDLRILLLQPNSPQAIARMVDFYTRLGRNFEGEAWKSVGALPE